MEKLQQPEGNGNNAWGALSQAPFLPDYQKHELSQQELNDIRRKNAEKIKEWDVDKKLGLSRLRSDLLKIKEAKENGKDLAYIPRGHFVDEDGEVHEKIDVEFTDDNTVKFYENKIAKLEKYKKSDLIGRFLMKMQEAKEAHMGYERGAKEDRSITM